MDTYDKAATVMASLQFYAQHDKNPPAEHGGMTSHDALHVLHEDAYVFNVVLVAVDQEQFHIRWFSPQIDTLIRVIDRKLAEDTEESEDEKRDRVHEFLVNHGYGEMLALTAWRMMRQKDSAGCVKALVMCEAVWPKGRVTEALNYMLTNRSEFKKEPETLGLRDDRTIKISHPELARILNGEEKEVDLRWL